MTPFDQPLQQGEYIPQTPQLPVQAIAQSANQLNQQVEGLRSIPDRVGQQISETAVAPQDRETFNQIFQQRVGQLESMTDDIEGLIDDPNAVTDLAGRITQDLQPFMQTQETYNDAIEDLEDTQMSADARETTRQDIASLVQTRVDDQGNLVPTTESIMFGDEPVDLIEGFQSSISDMGEEILDVSPNIRGDLGIVEFLETEGISKTKMRDRLYSMIDSNDEYQNQIRRRSINIVNRTEGLSFDNAEDRQRARQMATDELRLRADQFIGTQTPNQSISRRSLPDHLQQRLNNEDEGSLRNVQNVSYDVNTLPQNHEARVERIQDAEDERFNAFKENIQNNNNINFDQLEEQFGINGDNLIRSVMETTQEINRSPDAYLDRQSGIPGGLGSIGGGRVNISKEGVLSDALDISEADATELYTALERSNIEYERELNNQGVQILRNTENEEQTTESFKAFIGSSIANNPTDRAFPHIVEAIEDMEGDGFLGYDENEQRTNIQAVVNNTENVGMTSDGNMLVLSMAEGEVRDKEFQGGENIYVPLKVNGTPLFDNETIDMFLGDGPKARATKLNYEWSGRGIQINNDWTELRDYNVNGQARRESQPGGSTTYSIRYGDNNEVYSQYDEIERLVNQEGLELSNAVSRVVGPELGRAISNTENQTPEEIIERYGLNTAPYQFLNRGVALETIQMKGQN